MSESNRVRLAIRPEGSVDPWQVLRRTGDSLTAGMETVRSDEVRSDRLRGDLKKTVTTVGGSVDIEFSAGDFDNILAAAMCSAWATDVLNIGTDTARFEVLKSYLSEDRHYLMTGMQVGSLSLSMGSGAKVTGQIGFMGEELDKAYDPSGDTFDDPGQSMIMDSSTNLSSIEVDGVTQEGVLISAMSVEIQNNMQTIQGLGTVFQEHSKGSADITGSKTVRASQAGLALWDKADENTPIATTFTLGDGTTTYTFAAGREFLSGELPSGGLDTILTIDLASTLAVDADGKVLTITRTTTP